MALSIWSTLSGFRRSAKIFFFFSLSAPPRRFLASAYQVLNNTVSSVIRPVSWPRIHHNSSTSLPKPPSFLHLQLPFWPQLLLQPEFSLPTFCDVKSKNWNVKANLSPLSSFSLALSALLNLLLTNIFSFVNLWF